MKGWVKNYWLLIVAAFIVVVPAILIIFGKLYNNNFENAKYLLSAIPQVIATVFVLTIAIMQAVGGSEGMPLEKLFFRPEFIIAAVVSLVGITFPLFVLCFNWLKSLTFFSLCLSTSNLLVVGWFVWRIAPLQVVPKRLARLKRGAIEASVEKVPSETKDLIAEMAELGVKILDTNPLLFNDACRAIRTVIQEGVPYKERDYEEWDMVWFTAVEGLIKMDKQARLKGKIDLSENATMPVLREMLGSLGCKKLRNWVKLKEYLFECFRDDIAKKRVNFAERDDHKRRTSYQVIKNLFYVLEQTNNLDMLEPMIEDLIAEFHRALKNKYFNSEQVRQAYAIIFNAFVEGLLSNNMSGRIRAKSHEESVYLAKLDRETKTFAELANFDLAELLDQQSFDRLILLPQFKIFGAAPDFVQPKYEELRKRLIVSEGK